MLSASGRSRIQASPTQADAGLVFVFVFIDVVFDQLFVKFIFCFEER
jgi:hypothetical protein